MKRAATAAFQVLLDGLAAAQQAGEIRTDQSVELLVLAMWSTMHGMTALLSDCLPIAHVDHLLTEHTAASAREKVEQLMAQVIRGEVPRTPAASLERN